jgi:magnesium chelatase family protein
MKKMTNLKCATIDGNDAIVVDIESTFTNGLPSFSIVGLGNAAIQESKDRIKSSLLTNEFKFPPKKITINLSPSEVTKKGSHLDAAMALLIALHDKKVYFDDFFVFGELGLDGSFKDTSSIFVLILSLAKQKNSMNVLIPKESVDKVSKIPNINIFATENLSKAIEFFSTKNAEIREQFKIENKDFEYQSIEIVNEKYYFDEYYKLDFSDVKGQKIAKRGALISVAGNHNILFEGSPGCGKSMITKRMQYIMPPMNLEEILEKAKIDAISGRKPDFKPARVFSSPHHTSTKASILGGTKIGEIALCNNGILFFDELPYFNKDVLEALREPLEDHAILVSRVNSKIKYDTKFLFISAMNPCPCGNLFSKTKECRCNELEINRYKNRLSAPFLDRIDLIVTMSEISIDDKPDIDSATMHKIVLKTFLAQKRRGQKEFNGKLSEEDIRKYCTLDSDCQIILDKAITQFSLSFRAINKLLKVARTIADIGQSENIQKEHLLEGLSFRRR